MYNVYTLAINYLHVLFKCYLNLNMELQITTLLMIAIPGSVQRFLNQGMNCKYEYLLDAFHQIIQCNSGHIAEGSQCRKVFSLGFSELDKTFTTTSSAPCVWGYYTLVVNII